MRRVQAMLTEPLPRHQREHADDQHRGRGVDSVRCVSAEKQQCRQKVDEGIHPAIVASTRVRPGPTSAWRVQFALTEQTRDPWPSGSNCTLRSEEHTSELQSLMRISYAVFCLKKKQHRKSKPTKQSHHN